MAIANSPASPGQLPQAGQQSTIQLHDIHVPAEISGFPIAPGWWVLLALILLLSFWAFTKYKRNARLNADKNKALTVLKENESLNAKECIALLKWAAMQYFSRYQLAKMYGEDFKVFLINQLPEKHKARFNELATEGFEKQYQADKLSVSDEMTTRINLHCQQAAKLWLTHALPVKQMSTSINTKEQKA